MKVADINFSNYQDGVAARVNFGHINLSIVRHSGSYGGKDGLYEIGVFDESNEKMIELSGITAPGDTVKGFLTENDVNDVLDQITTRTGTNPIDITDISVKSQQN